MPPGNSVLSKSARSLLGRPASTRSLFATAALLLLGAALGLSGSAIRWVAHSRFTPHSSIPRGPHLGSPFLGCIVFGTAGLLVFFLLQALLGLIRMAIHGSSRIPPNRSPPAPVEESRAPTPAPPLSAASPDSDLQQASPRDSRFLTRAHFSGLKRRASDYGGPYRRACDPHSDADTTDAPRRASDSEASPHLRQSS